MADRHQSSFCEVVAPHQQQQQHRHDKVYLPWPPSRDSNSGHTNAIAGLGDSNIFVGPLAAADTNNNNTNLEESQEVMESCKRNGHSSSSPSASAKGKTEQNENPMGKAKARGEMLRSKGKSNSTDDNQGHGQVQAQPDHEIHIWTERERRKKMRNMFSNLHSLLPHLPPKADKSTIVDEAISYIRSLQRSLQILQSQKLDKDARAAAAAAATNLEYEPMLGGGSIFQQQTKEQAQSHPQAQAHGGGSVNLEGIALEPWTSQPALMGAIERCSFQTWASPNVVLSVCGEDAHIVICTPLKQGMLSTIFYILEKHKLEVVTAHISSDNCRSRSIYMIHAHAHVNVGDQYLESSYEDTFKSAIGEMMFYL